MKGLHRVAFARKKFIVDLLQKMRRNSQCRAKTTKRIPKNNGKHVEMEVRTSPSEAGV
jgi:hypothetical protein